jgi:DNA-binding NtrC family response regulator
MTNRSRGESLNIPDSGSSAISSIAGGRANCSTTASDVPASMDLELVTRAARSGCAILLTGETGVGKGRLARWLHAHSQRASGPFIPVNCGAIPDTLIDSQLFGHAKGAFSGATSEHLGLVRAAQKGTLLLDEVSELPLSAQTRLLRLLQEHEVQPVGRSQPIVVDVRVIAASNVELAQLVKEHKFREDLLFRLDVIQLRVPALRERMNELPALFQAFNRECAELYGQPELIFDTEATEAMRRSAWPGNIRQLRTVVERLHVLCPGETITVGHLYEIGQLRDIRDSLGGLPSLDRVKLEEIRRVLAHHGGSISRAALAFGVHRSTIYRWLRRGGPAD